MPLIPIAMALAQFAPMIAGWLGGSKAEDVATKVVGIAQAVTGQSAPDAAVAALQADPNLAFQFQRAVLDQQAHLAEVSADVQKAAIAADVQQSQIAAGDRDSARKREIEVRDNTPRVLAFFVIAGFLGMAFSVLFGQVRADTVLVGTVIGYMSAKAEQVIAYYFGSTSDSRRKTEIMGQATAKNDKG